jgi:myo-inositol-1-phosphate synthase
MWHLYKFQSRDLSEQVKSVLNGMQYVEKDVREKTGIEVRDLKILDIGAGQDLRNATYFAVHNDVVGIDLDEIVQGLDLRG